jgi:hypothetical protein
MLTASLGLSRAATDIVVCVDNDDPDAHPYTGYGAVEQEFRDSGRVRWVKGPRNNLSGWTNRVAMALWTQYEALASLGDDHLPRTEGWDRELLSELERMGGGFAYGNDLLQEHRLPTAVMVSSKIVGALGWLCPPALQHYFVDNVWRFLGTETQRLAYRQDIIIEHMHPGAGKADFDATYMDPGAEAGFAPTNHPDYPAWLAWVNGPAKEDVETVRRACAA